MTQIEYLELAAKYEALRRVNLELQSKIEQLQENCISLGLHDSRMDDLQSKIDKAIKTLKPFSGKDGYEDVNKTLAELNN